MLNHATIEFVVNTHNYLIFKDINIYKCKYST